MKYYMGIVLGSMPSTKIIMSYDILLGTSKLKDFVEGISSGAV